MPRTLTEDEFNAVKQKVLESLPSGLSEADFTRAVAPRMAAALGEAENLPPSVSGSSIGRFLGGAWQNLNPIAMAEGIYGAVRHPLDTASNIVSQQAAEFGKAYQLAKEGRGTEALGHAAAGAIPIIGPAAAQAGEAIASGDVAGGLGQGAGLLAPTFASRLAARRITPGIAETAKPLEAAAVEFGRAEGIPLDAATVTGNRFVRAAQHLAQSSPIGSVVAERAELARAKGLTATGERLEGRLHPEAVTPEQAGYGMRGGLEKFVGDMHGLANDAYGKLREIEQQPEHAMSLPVQPDPATVRAQQARMSESLGTIPTQAELMEMKRIEQELDAVPFKKGKLINMTPGVAGGEHYDPRSAGAPVYHDILQAAPGVASMTRSEVLKSIRSAVETGQFTNAAKGAYAVAKDRLAGSSRVSKPILPPDAGLYSGPRQDMLLPVDLTDAKSALQLIYDRLVRQWPITQQQASPALKALENIVKGPDFAPVSQVDADLSALKGLARGATSPHLRDVSQGLAAAGVRKVDAAVKQAVERAGPEAVSALEEGRAATTAKYAAGAVLEQLRDEPVQAYRQAIQPKDAGIGYLRQLSEYAPGELSKIGRAWLHDALGTATAEGGFDRTAKLAADWQKLGPETKKLLFGATTEDLDRFFLLAKRLGESPNPSKTALTLHSGATGAALLVHPMSGAAYALGSGAIATLLNTPRGIRLLTRGLVTPQAATMGLAGYVAQLNSLLGKQADQEQ